MKRLFNVMADNALASAVTLLVVFVFILFPLSFSRFNTAQTMREQYNLMDAYNTIYNQVTEQRPVVRTNEQILIVDISGIYDRRQLAQMLKDVMDASPKAVGLDVTFYERKDSLGDRILDSLASLPNVVSPCLLQFEEDDMHFLAGNVSFYVDSLSQPNLGFVNVELTGATQVCRTFCPRMYCSGMPMDNFAVLVAKEASENACRRLYDRRNEREYINYDRTGFTDISGLYVKECRDMIKDKIVLIGDKQDVADWFVTPMEPRQPGVEIHAHVIDTVINEKYIDVMSEAGAWMLAYIMVFLFIPFNALLKRNAWTALFIPVFQTLLILACVFVGYWIFVSFGYYVRVVYAMLALGVMEVGSGLYWKFKGLILKRN